MAEPFITDKLPSRFVEANGKNYIWFSGTDYLGMGHHPRLISLLSNGLQTLGTHFGSSRKNNLQIAAFQEAERALCHFTGAEDALLVSSGMLAGFLLRTHLPGILAQISSCRELEELEAPLLHPSLSRLPQTHYNWNEWAETAARSIKKGNAGKHYTIYSDAIGTPRTTVFDFELLKQLPATLVVTDDSHGLGVLGVGGKGSFQRMKEAGVSDVLAIASLNKAMGIPGGVVLGNQKIIDMLRETTMYAGASPIPPLYAQALAKMIKHGAYQNSHIRLIENNAYFLGKLKVKDCFYHAENYPVYTVADSGLYSFLLERNILVSCFPYPSKNDAILTRIVITAAHTREDLDMLASACNAYYYRANRSR